MPSEIMLRTIFTIHILKYSADLPVNSKFAHTGKGRFSRFTDAKIGLRSNCFESVTYISRLKRTIRVYLVGRFIASFEMRRALLQRIIPVAPRQRNGHLCRRPCNSANQSSVLRTNVARRGICLSESNCMQRGILIGAFGPSASLKLSQYRRADDAPVAVNQ